MSGPDTKRSFCVLITRPAEDVEDLAAALATHGISSVIEPLLSVCILDGPPIDLRDVSALLATSANGVRAFARRVPVRSIRVLAVGEATARAAREAGFRDVDVAGGNVTSLAELVRQCVDPAQGALVHVAGSTVAGDLAGILSHHGYTYRRHVLYEARAADNLPERAATAIRAAKIDGVLLYSPRTARTFCRLVRSADLGKACERIMAFCLSDAVAKELSDLRWQDIIVAAHADQHAMVCAVTRAAEGD